MDIHATVTRVRNEYKEYLRSRFPEWSETTVRTHASDAFYLWNNTIVVSFWKVFESEQSMSAAGDEMYAYLREEVLSNRAGERTAAYYKDLCMLKEFLDSNGGVRACIGAEYDAEAVVYQYAKLAYDGKITSDEAVATLCKEVPAFGETSHKLMVMLFSAMMEGTRYTRRANTETTAYFISHMGTDYGIDRMKNALYATLENVRYYYEQTGNKSNSIRRCCKKLAAENDIDISFGEDIFEGIIPKETTDSALVSDRSSVHFWIYSAGLNSSNWEQDYAEGIMAINWDEMGDLMQYSSKAEMRARMQELYGGDGSYKNQVLATWQFANEMKPGDIVFVKRGTGKIVGRGTVESDYIYAGSRKDYTNIRMVKWRTEATGIIPARLCRKC